VIDRRVERGEISEEEMARLIAPLRVPATRTSAVSRPAHSPSETVPASVVRLATGASIFTRPASTRITPGRSVNFRPVVAAVGALLVALHAAAQTPGSPARTIDLPWKLDVINWIQAYPNLSFGLVLALGASATALAVALPVLVIRRLVRSPATARVVTEARAQRATGPTATAKVLFDAGEMRTGASDAQLEAPVRALLPAGTPAGGAEALAEGARTLAVPQKSIVE
jgi:hypothetical protein